MTNAEYRENTLFLNGVYSYGNPKGYDLRAAVPEMDYGNWAVALQFRLEQSGTINGRILVGGQRCRWLVLTRGAGGGLQLDLNNHSFSHEFPDAPIALKQWCSVVCSFNLKEGVVRAALNGKVLPDVKLPDGFAINAAGTQWEKAERGFLFTDFGNGGVMHGHVDNLAIFSRSLTAEEIKTAAAAMAVPAGKKP